MARLVYTVTNHSLTFFIKGRPYSLTKDHQNYEPARAHLMAPDADHDVELLVDLVDARRALSRASFGRIQFDGDEILWQGKPLHNVWVERIIEFRERGEDHLPLFNALDKLVHNPTAAAIERLPIFLDRVALPFMPDGRFLAFKGVTSNYMSAYGGNFRHLVGDKPRMLREQVDADPNRTCSTGLHVGAPGYVRQHYSGGTYALVLVAVDPVDVVSVPTDYDGEKMRVCGYEVIEHLDQDYSDELFGRLRQGYCTPAPAPAPEPAPTATDTELATLACVGDTVTYAGHDSDGHSGVVKAGLYEVLEVDDADDGERLRVATAWDQVWLRDDKVTKVERDGLVLRPTDELEDDETSEFDTVSVGDVIEYEDGFSAITYAPIITVDPVQVRDVEGELIEVDDSMFVRVVPANEITASMLVTKGTIVEIDGHDFLQAGVYDIAGIEEDNGDGDQVEPDSEMWSVLVEGRRLPIRNRNIAGANHKSERLWPRAAIVVADEVDPSPAKRAVVDDVVTLGGGSSLIVDGDYTVTAIDDNSSARLCVKPDRGSSFWVHNQYVLAVQSRTKVETDGETTTLTSLDGHDLRGEAEVWRIADNATMTARLFPAEPEPLIGDLVEISGDGWPPAGIYPVAAVDTGGFWLITEHDGHQFASADRVKLYQSRPWMRAEMGGEVELGAAKLASPVGPGRYMVMDLRLGGSIPCIKVQTVDADRWVAAERVTAAFPKA